MSKIDFEFEIPQGYYTKEELNNNIQNNILNMVNTPFNAKLIKNGEEKDITLNFWDVVQKITINDKSIDFKELNKSIPELIEFQYGEKPVQKNKKFIKKIKCRK